MAQLWQIASASSPSCPIYCMSPFGRSIYGVRSVVQTRSACNCIPASSATALNVDHDGTAEPNANTAAVRTLGYPTTDLVGGDGVTGTGAFDKHGGGGGRGDGDGGGGHGDSSGYGGAGDSPLDPVSRWGGIFGAFLSGWNDRVRTDPQFPFKVLMEELVGVSACVIGDMASRPNFGLNELDFVFSTIVVGSILNFSLMYMLAPTSIASAMPSIFASCPPAHMFEQGSYSLVERLGTFVYKGALFASVGFAAGLLGTFISSALISTRKRLDPKFETQNEAPPTILNAATWAAHMGLSSNFRYQVVNGLEFGLAKVLPLPAFKTSVLVTRMLNNVLGGMSFVLLARLTGSQKAANTSTLLSPPTEDAPLKDKGAMMACQNLAVADMSASLLDINNTLDDNCGNMPATGTMTGSSNPIPQASSDTIVCDSDASMPASDCPPLCDSRADTAVLDFPPVASEVTIKDNDEHPSNKDSMH